jgi:hypothetical protein
VSHPPQALPHALHNHVKRAIIEQQGKRDNGKAGSGQQLERFCLLPQQNVVQLEHLPTAVKTVI